MSQDNYDQLLLEIGERLTQLRKNKGYSSHETFALDYDLPRVQYWRLEKGKANFTIRSLVKILEIHGLTVPEFFSSNGHTVLNDKIQNTKHK
jgi:transcriptional regulator with XRE-family HTH domain